MFKTFLLAAVLLLPVAVCAQNFAVTGTVRDSKQNHVLPGASVQIDGTRYVTATDEFGRFTFTLAAGSYTARVRFVGFQEKAESITVSGATDMTITLDESLAMTDEVVVLATRVDEKTPTTFTNVSKQAISKQNFGQDLPLLLNWTPSVVTTSDAGAGVGYTGIRIRGSDATRVNVTINGVPYNDSESQGSFWVDIPDIASSSQSIQVQRGVGTSTNGAGAFGASINLQTNTRNDVPYAEVLNSAGSFGTHRHTLSFGTGMLNSHWVIDGRLSKIASDGFIDRASSDLSSYYLSAGFYSGKTMVKAIAFGGKERTYQAWYGVPESRLNNDVDAMLVTASNEGWNEEQTQNLLTSNSRTFNPYTYKNQVDDYKQDNYQLHVSQSFADGITGNISLHYTPGKGYYEEYRNNDDLASYGLNPVTIGDSVVTSTNLVRRRWLDNDFYGFTYSFNYDRGPWNMVLGGSWNRYVGDHFGQILWANVSPVPTEYEYYRNRGDKKDFTTYLKTTYQFTDVLSGYVDLQYRRVLYHAAGTENTPPLTPFAVGTNYSFFNPKAGLVYTPGEGQQIYASYAIGNREPTRDDFVDAPNGRTPQHETLRNIEAGYRRTTSNYMLHANYYLMDYKNQLVLTGTVNDVGASIRTNVGRSYRMGVELEGLVRISSRFSWNANVTLSQNKIRNFTEVLYDYGVDYDQYNEVSRTHKDSDISFSPNVIAGSGFTYKPFRNLEATLLSKYVGSQYLDNTSNKSRQLDAYTTQDVRVSYTVHPSFMREIVLSVLVNNVLDAKYESNGYTWGYLGGGAEFRENYYFPQAGRNFMAMLALRF